MVISFRVEKGYRILHGTIEAQQNILTMHRNGWHLVLPKSFHSQLLSNMLQVIYLAHLVNFIVVWAPTDQNIIKQYFHRSRFEIEKKPPPFF